MLPHNPLLLLSAYDMMSLMTTPEPDAGELHDVSMSKHTHCPTLHRKKKRRKNVKKRRKMQIQF